MDRSAVVVKWQDRDIWHELCRRHAARPSLHSTTKYCLHDSGGFRVELRPCRHSPQWRVRAPVHELDIYHRSSERTVSLGRFKAASSVGGERPANATAFARLA